MSVSLNYNKYFGFSYMSLNEFYRDLFERVPKVNYQKFNETFKRSLKSVVFSITKFLKVFFSSKISLFSNFQIL